MLKKAQLFDHYPALWICMKEKGLTTLRELASKAGIHKQDLAFLSLSSRSKYRRSPVSSSGFYRSTAVSLSDFFQVPPEVLFEEIESEIEKEVFEGNEIVERFFPLDPHQALIQKEIEREVEIFITRLKPREELIVRHLFGIGLPLMRIGKLSQKLKITRSRIDQIIDNVIRQSVSLRIEGRKGFNKPLRKLRELL